MKNASVLIRKKEKFACLEAKWRVERGGE